MASKKIATIAVSTGLNSDTQHGCVVPPITLSTNFNFIDFKQPREHDYARKSNPSRAIVEKTLAELEQGAGAVMTNTGMSALHLLCTVLLTPGDLLIAPHNCYGGSYRLFNSQHQRGAYRVLFVDQSDSQALAAALAQHPKVVLIETPSNPLLHVVDIAEITQAAHKVNAIVAVDNTFLSPVLQQPLALGADIVIHSCTKYLNGHSDIVAGALICKDPARVTEFAWWANNIGVTGAPFDSYLLLRGLRTLVPRITQQQKTALKIVEFLTQHPKIRHVYHPSLPSNPGHEIARKQQKGFGAMLSFELDGDETQIQRFLQHLTYFTLAESLGGVESLICHPSTMTHAGMNLAAQAEAGISQTLFRVSVGLEDSDDLIDDLAHALSVI